MLFWAINPEVFFRIMNPEKVSSFNIHPERNCSDCCFFCRQKFGLTETPLHILQMKSLEIQKFASGYHKVRKDHCLCNRCFRLLDQEAKKFKRQLEGETEIQKSTSAKMTENDQDVYIGSGDTRGEYHFIIWYKKFTE